MTKVLSRVVVVVFALGALFGVYSFADAQTYGSPEPTYAAPEVSAPPIAYGGASVVPAGPSSGFLGFGGNNPSVAVTDAVAGANVTAGTGGGLAITGSEANLGLTFGIGLLALGGTAIIASRKRDNE